MSAQKMSDACAELGMPIERSVLAGLENGRRKFVTVAEVMVFGRALGVAPASLIFPLGAEDEIEIVPDFSVRTDVAAKWFAGDAPFPDKPEGFSDEEVWAWGGDISKLSRVRHLDKSIRALLTLIAASRQLGSQLHVPAEVASFEEVSRMRAYNNEIEASMEKVLRKQIAKLRAESGADPEVPEEFAYLLTGDSAPAPEPKEAPSLKSWAKDSAWSGLEKTFDNLHALADQMGEALEGIELDDDVQ